MRTPRLAAIINEHFIAVKVDRDERPDVDTRYQAAVSAISGQGGWPLTAFLTPEGRPFFGGTYFPPDDRYGRPGFERRAADDGAGVARAARRGAGVGRQRDGGDRAQRERSRDAAEILSPALVDKMVDSALQQFDPRIRRVRVAAEVSASGGARPAD